VTSIPRAARVSLWLGAWLRGAATPDDLLASLGPEVHVFLGLGDDPVSAVEALGLIRRRRSRVALALTAAGDPLGLAGPPAFNAAAMDIGEAVLLPGAGLGLIPVVVGGAVEWRCRTAAAPAPLDVRETRQHLRATLREVTEVLVDLQIATWSHEIPDLLINDRDPVPVPTDLPSQDVETIGSAGRCLDIVAAAAQIEPGTVSAWERARFEEAIRRLDASARRALVAACSSAFDSLASP
jgi:hypothetical protein